MDELYEALRQAEAAGNKEDVARLTAYIEEQAAKQTAPQAASIDIRDQAPKAIGAGAGAVLGPLVAGGVQSGIEQVKQAHVKPPSALNVPHPDELLSGVNKIDESLNKGFSNAITQHAREAQVSQREKGVAKTLQQLKAQGVPVNPSLLAEMPTQAARPGGSILLNADTAKVIEQEEAARRAAAKALPPNATMAQKIANKVAPNLGQDVASFAKGVSEYKLPFGVKAGPLLGRMFGGAATGAQGIDAYNRMQQGDTTGAVLGGIGAAGTGIATLPVPPVVRGVAGGVGLSAEAINAYRDAMRRGQIVHGAPENYENVDAMGNPYAHGGLVYLAEGGDVKKPFENTAQQNIRSLVNGAYPEQLTPQEKLAESIKARIKARAGLAGNLTGVEPSGSGGPTLLNPLNR